MALADITIVAITGRALASVDTATRGQLNYQHLHLNGISAPFTWSQDSVQGRAGVGSTISEDAHGDPGGQRGAEVLTLFQLCQANLLRPEYFILGLSMTADDQGRRY